MAASAKENGGAQVNGASPKPSGPTELNPDAIRTQILKAKNLAKPGNPSPAIEGLLVLEKQCRLAEEMSLSQEVCLAILEVTHKSGTWEELLEQITMLTKRRGQLKSTIQCIVRKATEILSSEREKENQIAMIKALQAVTEGKLFVEIDRARLTKRLARIYEADGKIAEAADSMQEMAVETFGAMHRSEKIAYVLDQMRLCMDNSDFTRAQILGRKVSPKAFAPGTKDQEAGEISLQGTAIEKPEEGTPAMSELKVLYYNQMIRFHKETNNYLEIVRCLLAIYADVRSDSAKWPPVLKQIIWYLALCPAYSTSEGAASDYLTLRATVAADAHLSDIPDHNDLLQVFITQEVTGVEALATRYAGEMRLQESIFGGDAGKQRVLDFRNRITEHNVMVVAKYYSQLRLARLAALLNLPEDEAEAQLSELVVKDAVRAKIDRPKGVVKFQPSQNSMEVLDGWGDNISKLLKQVETTCQKIQKESMQHNVPIGSET